MLIRPRTLQFLLYIIAVALAASSKLALAQWEIEQSHTRAGLRGVVSLGGGLAWASGTDGTVIRTEDGGYVWQGCAVPPGAEKLDLRGIQGWDENRAIVMSSGPGAQSRLYRTTDGCRSWKLLLTNTDKDGFWDAIRFVDREHGFLLGDPVAGSFVLLRTADGGSTWSKMTAGTDDPSSDEVKGESVFAASNSALVASAAGALAFCTGGPGGAKVIRSRTGPISEKTGPRQVPWGTEHSVEDLANAAPSTTSGCFSLAESRDGRGVLVAVGGDYSHPEAMDDTAWTSAPVGSKKEHSSFSFSPAKTTPHGYRSAVAYDAEARAWIAVGPNGSDVSTDDGQTWRPLAAAAGEATGADMGWNAVALPFAVGPQGKVGKLRGDLLPKR